MTVSTLATLAALGAFHGLNPAMGWLFAVARGLQERSRAALLRALSPIAAGHLASVGIVAALVTATRSVTASTALAVVGGVLLVAFGLWRLLSERHFRWAGMRLSAAQLAGWSFLMSSAHGAGLMLLPVLVAEPVPGGHSGHLASAPVGALSGLAAAGVHTVAMLGTALAIAILVYQVLGVGVLRRAWFNVDRLWAGVLVAAGLVTLLRA
ncbi:MULTISPECIES: hypothetical protein [Micromonospora]|uniref:Uncharacterized protein n=1 Tax=Micromonospora zamorensis TaxID=709883 RepID=A0ABZ1PJC7_9ACTN|nr:MULTISPECIES: hypothetical protein [Micromonospora]TQJ23087.1 hypothetical protein FBZ33_3350 [Micromonospora sp. A202]WSK49204.1 hypothetical protein OG423_01905 [Micromonospora zamorensis]WTE88098.1 hypothetical protein OHA01_05215 [Micromonospora zamorensis]WTI22864.1 hypothetical protein OG886_07260 [Micromonospora zamorensis]SCG53900.1 hypothetical protein GA0070619_3007 [Micromonospora zamorensis]